MQVLDIDFVSPNSACAYFEQHVISSGKSNLSDGWKILWCAIMCNLWNSRNNCIFRDKQFDYEDVIQSILFNCWSWLSAFNALFSVSYIQWMTNNSASLMGQMRTLMQLVTYDGGKQKSMIMQKFKDKVEHEKLSFGWHNYCVTGIFNLLGRNLRLSIKICFTIK